MLEQHQHSRQIDRLAVKDLSALPEILKARHPCIIQGMIEEWPARQVLEPRYLQERFADLEFSVSKDLPTDRSPLHVKSSAHVTKMRFKDFVDLIYSGTSPCYLSRVRVSKFPDLDKIVDFESLLPGQSGKRWSFLWVGSKDTNSGLHFDLEDTLLAQVYGEKKVTLVSPKSLRCVPVFPDNVFSSPIDVDRPDLNAFPQFAEAEVFEGALSPGDMIFIPQPWWHSLRSVSPSVSVSYIFGKEASIPYLLRLVAHGGTEAWIKTAAGFIVHGLLGKSVVTRIYSPPPTGRFLFELVRDGVKRRLPRAKSAVKGEH